MEPPAVRRGSRRFRHAGHRSQYRWSAPHLIPGHDPRSHTMSQTRIETVSHKAPRPRILGSAVRTLTLGLATLATGLVAGVFYAYAVSVNLGLAAQPDASYVVTMQAINARIQNPMFYASFFGAVLFLLATLAAHIPRPRSGAGTARRRRSWRRTWGSVSSRLWPAS